MACRMVTKKRRLYTCFKSVETRRGRRCISTVWHKCLPREEDTLLPDIGGSFILSAVGGILCEIIKRKKKKKGNK